MFLSKEISIAFLCIIPFSLLAANEGDDTFRDADAAFTKFKKDHGKSYSNVTEENQRKVIFRKNFQKIQDCNNANSTSTCDVNSRSDWSDDEWKASLGNRSPKVPSGRMLSQENDELAADRAVTAVDWTLDKCMTAVKNQGQCGSCWAFASTTPLEFAACRANLNKSIALSEQNLVDCSSSSKYSNLGCNGGFYTYAWDYVKTMGIASMSAYPYTAKQGTCKYTTSMKAAILKGYTALTSVTAMMNAVAIRPISTSIYASTTQFQYYKSGIISISPCSTNVDHAVVIVGYKTINGTDVWIVRNSWGTSWGMGGYAYVKRNVNMCGVELEAYSIIY